MLVPFGGITKLTKYLYTKQQKRISLPLSFYLKFYYLIAKETNIGNNGIPEIFVMKICVYFWN